MSDGSILRTPQEVLLYYGFIATQLLYRQFFPDEAFNFSEPIGGSQVLSITQLNDDSPGPDFSVIDIDRDGDNFLIQTFIPGRFGIHFKVRFSDYFSGLQLPIDSIEISAAGSNLTYYQQKNKDYMAFVMQKLGDGLAVTEKRFKKEMDLGANRLQTHGFIKQLLSSAVTSEFLKRYRESRDRVVNGREVIETSSSESEINSDEESELESSDEEDVTTSEHIDEQTRALNGGNSTEQRILFPIEYPDDVFNVRNSFTFGVGRGNPFGRSSA